LQTKGQGRGVGLREYGNWDQSFHVFSFLASVGNNRIRSSFGLFLCSVISHQSQRVIFYKGLVAAARPKEFHMLPAGTPLTNTFQVGTWSINRICSFPLDKVLACLDPACAPLKHLTVCYLIGKEKKKRKKGGKTKTRLWSRTGGLQPGISPPAPLACILDRGLQSTL
jgi:hypothetical protein